MGSEALSSRIAAANGLTTSTTRQVQLGRYTHDFLNYSEVTSTDRLIDVVTTPDNMLHAVHTWW